MRRSIKTLFSASSRTAAWTQAYTSAQTDCFICSQSAWYVELQSTLFYYLFTELFLMVDSRAKNAFPSFIGTSLVEDEEGGEG